MMSLSKKFASFNLVIVPLLLWGCGKPALSSAKDGGAAKNVVEGKWVSPCVYNSEPGEDGTRLDKSTKQSWISFSATEVTSVTKSFNNENCDKLAFTLTTTSAYRLADDAANAAQKNIDYTLKSIAFVYHIAGAVEDLNDLEFCGFHDWKANETREISGLTCLSTLPALPKKGDVIPDVVLREADKLYFGRPLDANLLTQEDGTPLDQRPSQVNRKEVMVWDVTP